MRLEDEFIQVARKDIVGRTAPVVWTGCALLLALVVLAVIYLGTSLLDDRPMPCNSDQVYVWDKFPSKAVCKAETDHESHVGA